MITISSTTISTVLTTGGGVITGVLGLLAAQMTRRSSRRAQKAALEIERNKVDAAAYTEARQVWDSVIKDLRNQSDDQRQELSDLKIESSHLRSRVTDMEQKRAGDRYAIHLLRSYAQQLLNFIKANELEPPQPPEELDLEK